MNGLAIACGVMTVINGLNKAREGNMEYSDTGGAKMSSGVGVRTDSGNPILGNVVGKAGVDGVKLDQLDKSVSQLDDIMKRLDMAANGYRNLDERLQFIINKVIGPQPQGVDNTKTEQPSGSLQRLDLMADELKIVSEQMAYKIDQLQDIL